MLILILSVDYFQVLSNEIANSQVGWLKKKYNNLYNLWLMIITYSIGVLTQGVIELGLCVCDRRILKFLNIYYLY